MPNQHTTRKQAEAQQTARRPRAARKPPAPDAGERLDALERRLADRIDDAVRAATKMAKARGVDDVEAKRPRIIDAEGTAGSLVAHVGDGPIGSHVENLDIGIDQLTDAIHALVDALAPILAPADGIEQLETPCSGVPLHDRLAAATTRIDNLALLVQHHRGRIAL